MDTQETSAQTKPAERFNYFRACLGESYTPKYYGSIEGQHPGRVREAMAEFAGTKAADVIAALVHSHELNTQVMQMQGESLQRQRIATRQADERGDEAMRRAHAAEKMLEGVREWINAAPHGDNCFVSDHYEGDPGNRCNCGKDALLAAIDATLEAAHG